jgi:8-oxo-dGTP pyrophosphatase MutT (NUDIX family)
VHRYHHEVLNSAGGPGVYGRVHFKMHATGTVAIDQEGNVILVGHYRFPTDSYSWEIPEGGGSADIPIMESAQRELREETGLISSNRSCGRNSSRKLLVRLVQEVSHGKTN